MPDTTTSISPTDGRLDDRCRQCGERVSIDTWTRAIGLRYVLSCCGISAVGELLRGAPGAHASALAAFRRVEDDARLARLAREWVAEDRLWASACDEVESDMSEDAATALEGRIRRHGHASVLAREAIFNAVAEEEARG